MVTLSRMVPETMAATGAKGASAAVATAGSEADGADSGRALRQAMPEAAPLVRLAP